MSDDGVSFQLFAWVMGGVSVAWGAIAAFFWRDRVSLANHIVELQKQSVLQGQQIIALGQQMVAYSQADNEMHKGLSRRLEETNTYLRTIGDRSHSFGNALGIVQGSLEAIEQSLARLENRNDLPRYHK